MFAVSTVVYAAPNFNNTIFVPEQRINTRSQLNGGHDGWFDGSTGDCRIISAGHWRSGVEYFLVEYTLFNGGTKRAFARRSEILVGGITPYEATTRQNTSVFRRSDMRSSFGTIWGGSRGSGYMHVVGQRGNNVQIIYRLDAGGHRMGWIPRSELTTTGGGQSGRLLFPLRGVITTSSTIRTNGQFCDYRTGGRVAVYAPADGTAVFMQTFTTINGVRTLTSYGNWIEFTSTDRVFRIRLAHLDSFNGVSQTIPSSQTSRQSGGTTITLATRTVRQGDLLGFTGTTGNSSGHHLHLEVFRNGSAVDPRAVFSEW
jgi:murein DD-endopeptidase MepM/ murein hydrolase activator NlpD